ncbi:DUF1427 family protein [Streptomyces cyaneofuscatus]|uniref:DUF1427 family protein n=1 Tax=Streptomyces TaxID=1883 RepID=UPI0009A19575|nr:DUF1427 domain-containing protein [Streptomyces sp. IB2014 011-12]CAD5912600.1 conserved protein of unknown function [Streptomyces sp. KY75]CAD5994616.1 conserved protein of unknown function [Streptomyces sp. KY70]
MRCRTPDRTEYVRGGGRRESPGWASSPLSRPRAAVPRGRTAPEQVPFYLQALSAGVLAGAVYALLRIRSPAPPLYGLIGLAGMPVGPTTLMGRGPRPGARHVDNSGAVHRRRNIPARSPASASRSCSRPLASIEIVSCPLSRGELGNGPATSRNGP